MSSKFETFEGSLYRRKVRAIIINDKNEVLLIQPHSYDDNQWTYVGGGVEEGEEPQEAMLREISEEVGIDSILKIQKSTYQHRFLFSPEAKLKRGLDYDGQSADLFLVLVSSISSVRIQAEEVKKYKWVPASDLEKYVTIKSQFKLFERICCEFGVNTERFAA